MKILTAKIPEAGYGKKIVLRNISLSIEEGEIAAFIGPNGAGKSTLLKVLSGIIKISNGIISLNGQTMTNQNPETIVRYGLLSVPQGNRVFTEMTVLENLEMGGYLIKKKNELTHHIESVLDLFPDLKERLRTIAGKLSGGEKQQLALARALILQPKVLLLDEPSLGLSTKLVTKAFETISDINKKLKTTILIVEQKVREVLKIANQVYGLRMGEIVFQGKPEELQAEDEMRKIFLL